MRHHHIRFALALAMTLQAALLLYLPALGYDFVWDDEELVRNNAVVKPPAAIIDAMATDSHLHVYWRPLTMGSLALDWRRGDGDPGTFHQTSLLLHLLCIVLTAVAVARLTGRRRLALLAALLMGLHPMAVESVAFISARDNLLLCAGLLLGLLGSRAVLQGRAWAGLAAFLPALVIAPGAKESGVLVVILPALAWISLQDSSSPQAGSDRNAPARALALTVVAIGAATGYLLLRSRIMVFDTSSGLIPALSQITPGAIPHRMGFILGKLLLPVMNNPDYYRDLDSRSGVEILGGLFACAALCSSLAWLWFRRKGGPLALGLLALASQTPFLGLVRPVGRSFSESWLYPALPAVCLAAAAGIEALSRHGRRRVAVAAALTLSLGGGLLSIHALPVWRDTAAITVAALDADPTNPRARYNRANEYYERGDKAEAESRYRSIIADEPDFGFAYSELGFLLIETGRWNEAEAVLRHGFEQARWYTRTGGLLANLLVMKGRSPEALALLDSMPRRDGYFLEYDRIYSLALLSIGKRREGLALLRDYLARYPLDRVARNMLEKEMAAKPPEYASEPLHGKPATDSDSSAHPPSEPGSRQTP